MSRDAFRAGDPTARSRSTNESSVTVGPARIRSPACGTSGGGGHSDRSSVEAALADRPRVSATSAVTLIVVIEQLFVTVLLTLASEVEPEATTAPRTARAHVHGTSAPTWLSVTLTRDLFVDAS